MPAWTFGYQANCWGPLGGDAVGVTSITRLTYRTFADMATAFREIGEVGYAGVELFDGNLLDYEGRMSEFLAQFLRQAYLSRLVDLHVVSGGQQEELRPRKQRVEAVGHSGVEVGVACAPDDPDRTIEGVQLGYLGGVGCHGGLQIVVQADECRDAGNELRPKLV